MSGITTYTVEPTTQGAIWYILSHSHFIAAVALLAGLLMAPLWTDTRDHGERTTMNVALAIASIVLTIALMLTVTLTVLGKIPGRIFYLAGLVVSALCLLAALLRGDTFTIALQSGTFVCWCLSLGLRRLADRLYTSP